MLSPPSYAFLIESSHLCILCRLLLPMYSLQTPPTYVFFTDSTYLCILYRLLPLLYSLQTPLTYVFFADSSYLCILYRFLPLLYFLQTPPTYVFFTDSSHLCILYRLLPLMYSLQTPPTFGAHLAMESMCELAARLLFSGVEWARNIPFFTELPLIDQVCMLRSCWTELFILNTAQCCPPVYIYSILSASFHPPTSAAESRYDTCLKITLL